MAGITQQQPKPVSVISSQVRVLALVAITAVTLAGACQQAKGPTPNTLATTVEEQRLATASQAMIDLIDAANRSAEQLLAGLAIPRTTEQAHTQGQTSGSQLWRSARREIQQPTSSLDDRPLYWARLASLSSYKSLCKTHPCSSFVPAFEQASRGMLDINFRKQADLKILVTGFDPFGLDRNVEQSNPSGVLALRLDNSTLSERSQSPLAQEITAELEAVVFPVRFQDFDDGVLESLLQPLLETNAVDAIFTLSMGRDHFDLERFPGRRRATVAPDNLQLTSGASATNPKVPLLYGQALPGPEYVEFSLPVRSLTSLQTPYFVNDNREVTTLQKGTFKAKSLGELVGQTAVTGSGGTYLSNEISFRSVRLVQAMGNDIAVGHIHLPRIAGHDEQALTRIYQQLVAMLQSSFVNLTNKPEQN